MMLRAILPAAVLALVVATLVASPLAPSVDSSATVLLAEGPLVVPSAAPVVASAVPAAPHPAAAAASRPAAPVCPTPENAPHWDSLYFFNDVEVTFFVPNSPALDTPVAPGSNDSGFQIAPCSNTLPTYANGFYMNVTTNVPMVNAVVTIWGTSWPTAANPQPRISGFDPTDPLPLPMNLLGTTHTTAEFYFDDYRFFWPGDHVYFNLTIQTATGSPSTIYSANPTTGHSAQFNYSGLIDNYTWQYYVQSVWGSTDFASNIAVSTTPSVLSTPAYEPNRHQSLVVNLTSRTYFNGVQQPIPNATLNITEQAKDAAQVTYSEHFSPLNSTTVSAVVPPNPGANASFTISAYLPWEHGEVDLISSETYNFTWTSAGGWWYPTLGLVHNLNLTSYPNVFLAGGQKETLPTGTEVNVTVHSPIENVTIGGAEIHVHYSDTAGSADGTIPMIAEGQNTSYGLIPGLPGGGTATFYVIVKDLFGTPIASGNTTYSETGAPNGSPGDVTLNTGYGIFFFEAVDLTTGQLVPFLNFTITNATWSETRQGTPIGFGAPMPLAGTGWLPVTYGTYVIQVRAFNQTETATIVVNSGNPTTVVFYVASGAVPQDTWVQQTTYTAPAVLGLLGAAVMVYPVGKWFRERRQKAEQEQRRITL
jgi:hypothetical protein